MTTLLRRLINENREPERANETVPISITDWARMFAQTGKVNFGGRMYPSFSLTGGNRSLPNIVYTCQQKRVLVFSEARMTWQRFRDGRALPGSLFGTPELSILETPWPGATTRDLLAVCEMDLAVHGNSYWIRDGDYLARIEPDTVQILTSAVIDDTTGFRVAEQLLGYSVIVDNKATIYDPRDIAHYKGIPDRSRWKGSSWIASVKDDIEADMMLTNHKSSQVRNGANLTHVISLDPNLDETKFDAFVEKFQEAHMGPQQAGKTLFLQGGSDIKTVGQTFEQLSLRATQGAGETRIAAAAGVSPVLLGLSEGLQGSALNEGNYDAAKSAFVDSLMCPLWGAFCAAFASLMNTPTGVRLWYDARDIPFLREDLKDQAEVLSSNATVISVLVTAGFNPDAVIEAVVAGDVSGLIGNHSGYFSVQLQKLDETPTDTTTTSGTMPAGMNGKVRALAGHVTTERN
jgi:hypothetical protein